MKNQFKFWNSAFVGPFLSSLTLKPQEIEEICLHITRNPQLNKFKEKTHQNKKFYMPSKYATFWAILKIKYQTFLMAHQ